MGVHILPVEAILFSYQAARRKDGLDVGGVRVQNSTRHVQRRGSGIVVLCLIQGGLYDLAALVVEGPSGFSWSKVYETAVACLLPPFLATEG